MEPMELGSDDESPTAPDLTHSKGWEPALTTVRGAVAFKRGKSDCDSPVRALVMKRRSSDTDTSLEKLASSRKVKTGYGIPEGETFFAHFPKYIKRLDEDRIVRRRETEGRSAILTPSDKTQDGRSDQMVRSSTLSAEQAASHVQRQWTCPKLLSVLVFLIVVGIALFYGSTYFLLRYPGGYICKLSRQFDRRVLEMDLESNVFGQHVALSLVSDKIQEYFTKFSVGDLESPGASHSEIEPSVTCKPLVLSFHGWTGVGKNYVSKIISDTFKYSKISTFVIPFHFPHEAFQEVYREQIHHWIVGNFSQCLVNVVILDEMDKASSAVVEGIADAISTLTLSCSAASPMIFLLLSNTYANDINRAFVDFMTDSSGSQREQLSREHFSAIFTGKSEAWFSKLAQGNLLDAFVPFLPLEKRHVIQCIKRDLVAKRFSTESSVVNRILKELSFSGFGDLQLSNTGCKRVADKVDYILYEKQK